MDPVSQERFEKLVNGPVRGMSVDDQMFLRARRDYMSVEELAKFGEIVAVDIKVPTSAPVESSKLDRRSLMKEAAALGIKFPITVTAPQLKALIDNAKFDAEAQNEAREENHPGVEEAEVVKEEPAKDGHKGNFSSTDQN